MLPSRFLGLFKYKDYIILLGIKKEDSDMLEMLRTELETYGAQKNELIGKSKGKFALVKDDHVIGVFDTKIDAIRQGYDRFGNVPFLVKQIVEVETPQNFTSNLWGK